MTTDYEALAQRLEDEAHWLINIGWPQPGVIAQEAAAALRELAASFQAKDDAIALLIATVKVLASERDQLRAEVERMKEVDK